MDTVHRIYQCHHFVQAPTQKHSTPEFIMKSLYVTLFLSLLASVEAWSWYRCHGSVGAEFTAQCASFHSKDADSCSETEFCTSGCSAKPCSSFSSIQAACEKMGCEWKNIRGGGRESSSDEKYYNPDRGQEQEGTIGDMTRSDSRDRHEMATLVVMILSVVSLASLTLIVALLEVSRRKRKEAVASGNEDDLTVATEDDED